MQGISVIIPTFNEEGNITELVHRLNSSLTKASINHELIVIDDHSFDGTWEILERLRKKYPLNIEQKIGQKGKAFSLLQGFQIAKFDTIAMIDADLQYPPEAITAMYGMIEAGGDLIVSDREYENVSKMRKLSHFIFKFLFGKMLHGLDVDVQSGLKVFRKEIIEKVSLSPTQWTFDLEFLLKAQHLGYKFASYPIIFKERTKGESKIKFLQAVREIAWSAILLKLSPWDTLPHHDFGGAISGVKGGRAVYYKGKEYVHHTNLHPKQSALFTLTAFQKLVIICFILVLLLASIINWHMTIIFVMSFLSFFYFTDLLHNTYLIYRSYKKKVEINIAENEIKENRGKDWPVYTILCPLYKEASILPQFVESIRRLEYPENRLQVLLLLEEDDRETLEKSLEIELPAFMETIVVPTSDPKTKPKACNFGLKSARGEYCVIYDAEDVPDPLQLKKAVLAFERLDSKIQCIQAKLNFYNPHQNLLTKLFTGEYTLWFDLILTGLQSVEAPIPLGGTSNHFRTEYLQKLSGWDAFNVTEDCDLGMRLANKGYKTAIINSVTLEEANSNLINWFNQRTRWVKGYIQTYFVHMRDPKRFFHLQLVVGGKVLSMLVNPIMWILFFLYFAARPVLGEFIESLFPTPVFYIATFSLVIGNFLYFYNYMLAMALKGKNSLVKYAYFVPIYWLFMSAAAWVSIYRLVRKPHHWSKTVHGLHLKPVPAFKVA